MKTEQAIELLHRISDSQFDGIHGDERRKALEMAVRALEQNLVQESGDLVQDLVKDCISRQQAIEAFEPTHYMDWYTPTIIETLEALPSVQPEVLACGSGELVEASRRLVEASPNDLISRQQAIDALDKHIDTFDAIDTNYLCGLRTAMSILKEMPSARPDIIRCKDCKYWVPGYITDNDDFIPPKCGEWQQMVGHSSDDYCSLAERREVTT